jgi:predicted MPP superfamily phosphohydrolase
LTAVLVAVALAAVAGLGWMLFEAQWVERLEREVSVPALPPELDGLTVLHLSDFHLGTVSFNGRALRKAVEWAEAAPVDLVAITGDLVSRRRGERALRRALDRLRPRHGTYAVLGNHDVAATRDPFSSPADLTELEAQGAQLLEHDAVTFDVSGPTVQVAGADPRKRREGLRELADPEAGLRILLVHFPDDVRSLVPGDFHLVLAGHLHGGQICIPIPGGKVRLEHLRAPYWEGLFELPVGALHVSRGLGTSLVPFRLFARPEATRLTIRAAE